MKYNKFEIQKVKEADIRLFVPGCAPRKASQEVECPFCGAKKFSVVHKTGKNFASCFACKQSFSSPIDAVMHYKGYGKADYLKVVEEVAATAGITLVPEDVVRKTAVASQRENLRDTFCAAQLRASGLTEEDVMAYVLVNGNETYISPFQKGRLGPDMKPDLSGADMLIYYYDLNGRPMQYKDKRSTAMRPYVRVRWANPDIHQGQDGKPMKYQTPSGASSRIYIPERIRKSYRNSTKIETLYLQEGEKKAEKACMHGMPSIGIQGINNFGSAEAGLIQDIQDLVARCSVDNVVLMMDADWNDLSHHLSVGGRVDTRPNAFASAVIKFQQYMRTFHNLALNVEIWWGHVNQNEHGDKGVDDLLVGFLAGREDELAKDATRAMNSHDGKSKWVNIHRISTLTALKIREFWHLGDASSFYAAHRESLKDLATFKIGQIRYKIEDGKLAPISRYASDGDIYSIAKDSKENDIVVFNATEAFRFLNASGFFRIRNNDSEERAYDLVRIEDGIIDKIASYEVRDFIRQYVNANTKSQMVLDFFTTKLIRVLSDAQLENLEILNDDFSQFEKDVQRTGYNNGVVEITSSDIIPGRALDKVWRKQIVPRNFQRIRIFKDIRKEGDRFIIEGTPESEECEFLQYLANTSNMAFDSEHIREFTPQEWDDLCHHMVNKITTIGYLLTDFIYESERNAVVIQDHKMSEVGQSFGGAGKSLLGTAIGKIKPQTEIDGKDFSVDDKFTFQRVTRSTRNVFIDDVRPNFNFQSLFNKISGTMIVQRKQMSDLEIPAAACPKFMIATNHAIKDADEGSIKRRISYVEYSSWYNSGHQPVDDFHHMLFSDWDDRQWALFDNLMAECVMYYFRSREQQWYREGKGAVPPPMRNIELRTLRQNMSEVMYQWAEEYFDPSGTKLNERLCKQDVYNDFLSIAGDPRYHGVTPSGFTRKLQYYCRFKGYDFNPTKNNEAGMCYADWKPAHPSESFIGEPDKSNGKIYITVHCPDAEHPKPF